MRERDNVKQPDQTKDMSLDLDFVDFTDLERIEESIAPVFAMIRPVGGACGGATGSGCTCHK